MSEQSEIIRLRVDYERACKTVAEMHAVAVGEIRGPIVGVVEDVANVRAELLKLRIALQDIHARASAVINNGFPDEAPAALAGIAARAVEALKP